MAALCNASSARRACSAPSTSRGAQATPPRAACGARHGACVHSRAACRATAQEDIKNLPQDFCDNFQCDSSPQVERTIRTFARGVGRGQWPPSLFAEDVVYKERGICTFKGRECYSWNTWNRDHISDYTATVTSMEVSRNSQAEVKWAWSGKFGPVPVAGSVLSTLTLNLLTGKVLEHTDDVRVLANPLAQLAYGVQKGLWARKQGAHQMGDKMNRALDRFSMDDSQDPYTPDPLDPNKFIQQNDTTFQDGVQWALFLTILWGLWTAYSNLEGF